MSNSTFSLAATTAVASRMFSISNIVSTNNNNSNNNINNNNNNINNNSNNINYLEKDNNNYNNSKSNINILNGLDKTSVGQFSMVTGDAFEGDVGTVGEKFCFQVVTVDRNGVRKTTGGDLVSVHIQGCDYHNLIEEVKVNVVDKNNGTHNVHYHVTKSGHYFINVFVNHVAIQGSPYKVNIEPIEYSITIQDIDDIEAGEEFRFEILQVRTPGHTIHDKIEIETYINENGTVKKTTNDFSLFPSTDTPDSFYGRGKLIRSGEYIIEGSIFGAVVFSKTIHVNAGPVSSKYTHLLWDGKELITENKLFILPNNSNNNNNNNNNNNSNNNIYSQQLQQQESELKFLVQTKDQFGNISKKLNDNFEVHVIQSLSPISMSLLIDDNNSNNQNNNQQQQQQKQVFKKYTPELLSDDPRGLVAKLNITECGWYYIVIKLHGTVITNCPFTVIAVKESDCSFLSSKYRDGYATFDCQIKKNKKLTNVTLSIMPNVTLLKDNELLIKDNKDKVYLKNFSNSFLILLTIYYFFGDQTEPTFESKVKWFKSRLGRIQNGKVSPLKLNITSRERILDESLSILRSIDPKELIVSRMIVKFMNEEGVDIGADRHLSIRFTPAFYKLLLNEPITIQDLELIDPQLYKNQIMFIKNTPIEQVNEILGEPLYFIRKIMIISDNSNNNKEDDNSNVNSYHQQQHQQQQQERVINLKPFGNLIRVTDENKDEYLDLLVNNMLYGSVKTQIDEFREGFFQLIPLNLISIFNWKELDVLVCGKTQVNIDDLKIHSNVTGFVSQDIIDNFWNILSDFNERDKKQLLKFVTGSSSVPLGGFYQLYPHFTINITPNTSNSRLPVSHTCFNRIDIPRGCTSYHTLKQNLLLAINEASEGFSLV
ncbi:ubiquitin-protein ligase domain-containing protein [Heterostelium album PN500]|uniref:HECT-type E3 ubiquitin transferase n=1 Tax=Heterostelium pallidum (strain ATCC 26659 / Pp 5 / PN500) TaxID=670386 RepID=D3BQF4_HETP5|nr:ubiquitin-protein ligase domain-containing protein [Heterostelium album PN500]EFA76374.1 ubiquitin-protein ligase domain-containing protein [Heterostelium album PN500]|eukprot:XP_020428506.1 ubiquitin-protein ligase domain-containing protein [Heterostelium album PN500]